VFLYRGNKKLNLSWSSSQQTILTACITSQYKWRHTLVYRRDASTLIILCGRCDRSGTARSTCTY